MAVQDEASFKRYAANGIATVYAIPFLLLSAEDLQVVVNGADVMIGFTVSGVGTNTGSIVFDAAPVGDLLLKRVVPFDRYTDYQDNGDLLAQSVNRDFDRLWLAMQELRRDDSTALRTNLLEPEGIPTLPLKAQRALRLLAFNAEGEPIPSGFTLDELEKQPDLAREFAQVADQAAKQSATYRDASGEHAMDAWTSKFAADGAARLAQRWASEREDVPVDQGLFSARHYAAKAAANAIWANQPIGVPIPIWDHIRGVSIPSRTNPAYRYIKLSASDGYNSGVLAYESVSGSAPLVQASALIHDALSPLNGQNVRLINTERRALRAGNSGLAQQDALQNITGFLGSTVAYGYGGAGYPGAGRPRVSSGGNSSLNDAMFDASRVARTDNETRAKNIGVTYYMRIR